MINGTTNVDNVQAQRPLRILCLHGWRTSGKILSMQTAAMQYHTPVEFSFVTAPHIAEGPPDCGVSLYYPNQPYYEWYIKSKSSERNYVGLEESVEMVLSKLVNEGPFHGILGFSQGAAMATKLVQLQESGVVPKDLFKFVILIGGVPPLDYYDQVRNNHSRYIDYCSSSVTVSFSE